MDPLAQAGSLKINSAHLNPLAAVLFLFVMVLGGKDLQYTWHELKSPEGMCATAPRREPCSFQEACSGDVVAQSALLYFPRPILQCYNYTSAWPKTPQTYPETLYLQS